jgi:hypothetical protein
MMEIHVTVDKAAVEKKLGDLAGKSRVVISRGINRTAKDARKRLAEKAQETYTVKKVRFNRELKIVNSNAGNLTAILKANGSPLLITAYKHRAAKVQGGKAQILTAGSLKPLDKNGIKAFKRKGMMLQRTSKSRYPLEVLYSNSVPVMLGQEQRVYGIVEPHIKSDLEKNIDKAIARLIGG